MTALERAQERAVLIRRSKRLALIARQQRLADKHGVTG